MAELSQVTFSLVGTLNRCKIQIIYITKTATWVIPLPGRPKVTIYGMSGLFLAFYSCVAMRASYVN